MFFLAVLVSFALSKVYFNEGFDDKWEDRWVYSTVKGDDYYGKFEHTAGEWYGDAELDKGLMTTTEARHYVAAAKFEEELDNTEKTTVIQYTVKQTNKVDCAGSYLKLGAWEQLEDLTQFKDDTEYSVMFGPDVCGTNKVVHLIFSYKGNNLLWKKKVAPPSDRNTHVFTAVFNSDNTYKVLIDGEEKESGTLEEDWDFLPEKEIPDPEEKKPEDWVDEAKIQDPEDIKPEDWDDQPKFISDPEAAKPEDWDEEEDGEWEAPQIPNPEWKGEWKPKMIDNPEYKGEWKAKMIPNPEYEPDDKLYLRKIGWVGIEVWQVKTGTIFDNILVTDSEEEAKEERNKIMERLEKEKEMLKEVEEEEKKKEEEERKKREEEIKAKEEEEKLKKEAEEAEEILKEAEEAAESVDVEEQKENEEKKENEL